MKALLKRLLTEEKRRRWIISVAHLLRANLLYAAYEDMGVLKFQNDQVSGEHHLLTSVLPKYLGAGAPVLFDVGANRGNYARSLRSAFPQAKIYAFEPEPENFADLQASVAKDDVICINAGFDAEAGQAKIYDYADKKATEHASLYKDVLVQLHGASNVRETAMEMMTVDGYCAANNIGTIDFLKIDTEGNELRVLQGAKKMLAHQNIHLIQFEFNEMNIVSRSFLRDFYDILPGFEFYRLHSNHLVPLYEYSSWNEIFKFQNIFAVNTHFSQNAGGTR